MQALIRCRFAQLSESITADSAVAAGNSRAILRHDFA